MFFLLAAARCGRALVVVVLVTCPLLLVSVAVLVVAAWAG